MTPRELIAKAIARGDYGHYGNFCEWEDESPDLRAAYFNMADAVIDALEGMEVTEAMYQAWLNAPVASMDDDSHGRTDCGAEWRAMVGAMRDE